VQTYRLFQIVPYCFTQIVVSEEACLFVADAIVPKLIAFQTSHYELTEHLAPLLCFVKYLEYL
jgi:hypothetical protein